MREEAEDRDCQLIEPLDKREQGTRECGVREANRQDELMPRQKFLLVKDSRRGLNKSSSWNLD